MRCISPCANRSARTRGSRPPRWEARLIAATAAGKSTEKLLRDMRYYATDEVERRAEEMVQRRLAGEPVAYITASGSSAACLWRSRATC